MAQKSEPTLPIEAKVAQNIGKPYPQTAAEAETMLQDTEFVNNMWTTLGVDGVARIMQIAGWSRMQIFTYLVKTLHFSSEEFMKANADLAQDLTVQSCHKK